MASYLDPISREAFYSVWTNVEYVNYISNKWVLAPQNNISIFIEMEERRRTGLPKDPKDILWILWLWKLKIPISAWTRLERGESKQKREPKQSQIQNPIVTKRTRSEVIQNSEIPQQRNQISQLVNVQNMLQTPPGTHIYPGITPMNRIRHPSPGWGLCHVVVERGYHIANTIFVHP